MCTFCGFLNWLTITCRTGHSENAESSVVHREIGSSPQSFPTLYFKFCRSFSVLLSFEICIFLYFNPAAIFDSCGFKGEPDVKDFEITALKKCFSYIRHIVIQFMRNISNREKKKLK